EGANGLYTAEFLKAMAIPGLSIEGMLKHVRQAVQRQSKGEQTPWEASSLTGEFYFIPDGRPAARDPSPSGSGSRVPSAVRSAVLLGTVVKDCAQCPELIALPSTPHEMGQALPGSSGQRVIFAPEAVAMGKYEVTFTEWD